jgi:hypothetical protein
LKRGLRSRRAKLPRHKEKDLCQLAKQVLASELPQKEIGI